VIVVDDDASMRRALQMQLQVLGFDVLVFPGAEEMLAAEFPLNNACLLLDIFMPGMNGIELCRILAASERQPPTVLMSGRNDQDTAEMIRQASPGQYLSKPFDEKTLLRAIKKALKRNLVPH
jgi:two-component system response regulator FixJ